MFGAAFLDKAAYWVNLAYIVSVCLTVTTSVIVVFISNQRAALRDVDVRKVQEETEARIAVANQMLAEANERAAASNAEAAQAQAKAAEAALAETNLRRENLQLSIDLEREKEVRLESEQRAAQQPAPTLPPSQNAQSPEQPRVLTAEQEQLLLGQMRYFAEKHVTIIELGDPEAGALARQITSVLEKAGWNVFVSRVGALVPVQYGVICAHSPGDGAASALISSLRSVHLVVYDRTESVDQFQMIVGLKRAP